jgi:hypothetical protein
MNNIFQTLYTQFVYVCCYHNLGCYFINLWCTHWDQVRNLQALLVNIVWSVFINFVCVCEVQANYFYIVLALGEEIRELDCALWTYFEWKVIAGQLLINATYFEGGNLRKRVCRLWTHFALKKLQVKDYWTKIQYRESELSTCSVWKKLQVNYFHSVTCCCKKYETDCENCCQKNYISRSCRSVAFVVLIIVIRRPKNCIANLDFRLLPKS